MGTWQLDPYHTQVEFAAKHLGMMTVRGHFTDVKAGGHIDPAHPEASSVEVTVQMASIRTHNEQRDNDLRGSNILEIDKYPTMTFKSTGIKAIGEDRYELTGDLTIKDTTKPVAFSITNLGEFNDPAMGHRIAYSGQGKINRRDYGITFDMMLDGRLVVSNELQISLEGELLEAQGAEAEAAAT
jgi:polyisoprenoid-binding protein YceI